MMQHRDRQGIRAMTALGLALAALALVTLVAVTPAMAVAGAAVSEPAGDVVAMDHHGLHHAGDVLVNADADGSTCADCGACVGLATGMPPATLGAAQADPVTRPAGIPATNPESPFRPPVISL